MEERIVLDPAIQHGKPVVRGTRVPVVRLLAELAEGAAPDEIVREYGVSQEDLAAAIRYAVDLLDSEKIHPLPASA